MTTRRHFLETTRAALATLILPKSFLATTPDPGCPHEEGEDFPHGEDCPICPFWKDKQGSNRKE